MTGDRVKALVLGIAIFVMGGCGIAYEYTLSKVSSDLLGNSVQQWAVVIAVMLFFMGVGAELQQRISDRRLIDVLVASQVLLALLGGFGPLFLIQTFAFFPLHFSLVHYALISICGLLIGLEIPLITRLNEAFMPTMRKNIGKVLRMDYAGALVGGLFWTFLLIPRFAITETALILSLVTLSGLFVCLWSFRQRTRFAIPWLVVIAVTMGAAVLGLVKSGSWALDAEQSLYKNRVVYSATSLYQRIVLTESLQGNLRCYINGHLQFSEDDEFIYHELLTHPAFVIATERKRVLILGGGDGLAVREALKYPDVETITLVDLDPFMTKMAREQKDMVRVNQAALQNAKVQVKRVPAEGTGEVISSAVPDALNRFLPDTADLPEVELVHHDAASYLSKAVGRYDVIVLDFPDPSSPGLTKLYGLAFYGQLRGLLNKGGVIIQQSTSPWHAREAFCCIGRTIRAAGFSAIPLHANVPSFGDWGWWIAVPQEERTEKALEKTLHSIVGFEVPTRYLNEATFRSALAFAPGALESDADDITTMNNPAIYRHYLKAWQNSH